MPCYHPVSSLYRKFDKKLIYNITKLSENQVYYYLNYEDYEIIDVPCNKCVGCIKKKGRDWVCRLAGEMVEYQAGHFGCLPCSFITLTFRDDDLPGDYKDNMHPEYISKFFKKVKDWRRDKGLSQCVYYGVPEYGEKRGRLHYHAIVIGDDFMQKPEAKVINGKGRAHYITEDLSKLWTYGRATTDNTIGVGLGAICYTTNYLQKDDRIERKFSFKRGDYVEDNTKSDWRPRVKLLRNSPGIGDSCYNKYKEQISRLGYHRLPQGQLCGCPRHWLKKMDNEPVLKDNIEKAFEYLRQQKDLDLSNVAAMEYVDLEKMKNHIKPLHEEQYTDILELNEELKL